MRNRKTLTGALLCVLLIAGCTKQVHPKHPNQLNDLDGYAYDSLTVAQASLDEAKAQLASGKFDDRRSSAVEIINGGGASYDLARTTYVAYRDAASLNAAILPYLEQRLRDDLQAMAAAVGKVRSLTGGK